MWARWIELSLGLWLLLAPRFLAHEGVGERFALFGLLPIGIAVASILYPGRRIYLLIPVAGIALVTASVLVAPHPLPLLLQNNVVVGLVLLMLGVVPDRASDPPPRWRNFEASRTSRGATKFSSPREARRSGEFSGEETSLRKNGSLP